MAVNKEMAALHSDHATIRRFDYKESTNITKH